MIYTFSDRFLITDLDSLGLNFSPPNDVYLQKGYNFYTTKTPNVFSYTLLFPS